MNKVISLLQTYVKKLHASLKSSPEHIYSCYKNISLHTNKSNTIFTKNVHKVKLQRNKNNNKNSNEFDIMFTKNIYRPKLQRNKESDRNSIISTSYLELLHINQHIP